MTGVVICNFVTSRAHFLSAVWPEFCTALHKRKRRMYRKRNASALSAYKKHYRALNKRDISIKDRLYRQRNKEHIRAQKKRYKQLNAKRISEHDSAYRRANRAMINAQKRRRMQSDPAYRLAANLRRRLRHALNGHSKSASTMKLLGCSVQQCMQHLESQFQNGMTWENRSEWHIDHIRPVASFDLHDPKQQRACFHYTNLQPLWAIDNLRKGSRWEPQKT